MCVDDLVYKLFSPEMYEFKINGITYGRQGDIPDNILSKNVSVWEVKSSTIFAYLYCLEIDTWDHVRVKVANGILKAGFSMRQINDMLKSGTSLSTITDMALSLDAVITAYTKLGYNKHNVRSIVYEIYADELLQDLNKIILGQSDTQ